MASLVLYNVTLNPSTGASTGGGISGGGLSNGGTTTVPGTSAGNQINYNRGVVLLGVSNGTVKVAYNSTWQPVTNGTSALSSSSSVIRTAVNSGKIYFVDGVNWKYYDPATNAMYAWTASAGTLPVDNNGNLPRLICNWRARIVVAGFKDDPYNLYMSAQANARDWDYSPESTSATQAVAGNLSPVCVVEDVITSLMPMSDDVLGVGGDHTLWMLQGDPMAGGVRSRVSDTIGVAFGNPWCKDPFGTVYFLSNLMGIYSWVPGQQPQRISQPIEGLLSTINVDSVTCRMIWDDALQGLHVLVTYTAAEQATTHYFWEQRTGAWWQDTFTDTDHDPLCALSHQGNLASDRVALIGSWDGYVRAFSSTATTDDGENISSSVVIGPLMPGGFDDILLKEILPILSTSSGDVTYAVHVGQTAEAALASTAVQSGTWSAGRGYAMHARWSGWAIYIKITATTAWAMEGVRVKLRALGKVRSRMR